MLCEGGVTFYCVTRLAGARGGDLPGLSVAQSG